MIEENKPKVAILTETHLTVNRDVDEFMIPGYSIVNCISRSAHTGGVLIFVAENLKFNTISNKTTDDNWFAAIEICNGAFNGIFAGVYHSPSSSDRDFIEYFETWLQELLVDEKLNVICGDFNIRWDEGGYARDLKAVTDAAGLQQKVTCHTRTNSRSSTMIDLVFSNFDECEANVVNEWKISDHETIGIYVPAVAQINTPAVPRSYTSWRRYSRARLQSILRDDLTLITAAPSMNENATALSNALASAVQQLTVVRSASSLEPNSWYGTQLREMKGVRDAVHICAKLSGEDNDWKLYNLIRNSYVRELRTAKNGSIRQEIERCSGDSKRLWKCLKTLIKPGGEHQSNIVFEGAQPVTDAETAKKINEYFISSVQAIHDSIPMTNMTEAVVPDTGGNQFSIFEPITMQKLKQTVQSLKKCSGTDNVTKQVLVDALDVVGSKLLDIINASLQQGVFPETWKKSTVIPIPKVPNSTRVEDRRPINMLPLYEKVLETLVKEQLLEYVDASRILLDEQSGFRKQHSCESALNLLLLKWKQSIERGKTILAVFIDLKRAFETIDRQKLLGVLRRYGIRGTVLKWFSSYLENRAQVTRYNGATSPAAPVNLGVPQGSVLGPLLFILYVNDISKTLEKAEVNLFADDTAIYVTEDSSEKCVDVMNGELSVFAEWLKLRKLKLNVNKTKCMIVTTRRSNECNGIVRIDGEAIERVDTIKYLGVMVDSKLSFNEHVDYTIRKAARKFGVLCRLNRYLSFDNKLVVYKTLIAPHFDYCASVLFLASKQQQKRMQILQNKVMRLILGCDRLTPRLFMLDSLQWMSIRQRVEYNTLIFVYKLTNGMAPRYLTENVVYGRDVHRYETRRAGDLRLMNFKKSCTQNSLFYKGYSLYNELPEATKRANNLREFKRLCKTFVKQRPLV